MLANRILKMVRLSALTGMPTYTMTLSNSETFKKNHDELLNRYFHS
jgi:hypothetical protein